MYSVGLSGGIGSGKSLIRCGFESIGVSAFNSDKVAKKYVNDSSYDGLLESLFGSSDRNVIAKIAFNDKVKLKSWTSCIALQVMADYGEFQREHINEPYVICESALIHNSYELPIDKFFDKIITVTADKELRIQRVLKRSGGRLNRKDILKRMAIQDVYTDDYIKTHSDFIIENNGTNDFDRLMVRVKEIDRILRNRLFIEHEEEKNKSC